ncbi:NAD(P)/FAD-dependent oxidoreductase [Planosporangium mesophilum]|uniref:Pyridine nucleotide-disulfide oxidoreductase n=1 Tax=Planosporangium mesophilum TaxID=689768 RepID=A0A8J3X121_9ACTN|nr:FAD-dependent oxidoreductase [Planosporangium mesophilum]NJC84593.1 FAD-dependent oxidoreductase [Planosporangium mesophilum]GII23902.1 pyridine nucleotide-disulfide oxidoreductase [Planosporangium mesophilum]
MTGTGALRSIAVVGASLAGLAAVRALRGQGYDGEIVAIGAERHEPYDRPPLSKDFLTGRCAAADLALGDPDEDLAVDWRLGATAVRLDAHDRGITLADGTEIRADAVVLATGARARQLPGTGGLAGVHTLRTLDDAVALRADLAAAERLVVIGAGFIGAEVASSARSLGLDVTVVEALPVPLAGPLGVEMGTVCAGLHADHGVRLLTGTGVARLLGSERVTAVELADGTLLPADVVVVGVGAQPNVEWLAGSGLELAGGVVTDAAGATKLPGVVATGDCAVSFSPYTRRVTRTEHWTHAHEQPAAAVATLLGGTVDNPRREYAPAPYFWSDQYGVRIQFAGHRTDGDAVRIIEGHPDDRSFLALYERDGQFVAALAMNQPKLFTRWRRQLRVPAAAPALMTPGVSA